MNCRWPGMNAPPSSGLNCGAAPEVKIAGNIPRDNLRRSAIRFPAQPPGRRYGTKAVMLAPNDRLEFDGEWSPSTVLGAIAVMTVGTPSL